MPSRALFVASCIALLAPFAAEAQAPARTASELAARLRTAHDTRDSIGFNRLIYWNGATAEMRRTFQSGWVEHFARKLTEARIIPLEQRMVPEYVQNGVTYQLTLTPLGQIRLVYAGAVGGTVESTVFAYGRKDGGYYIVTAAPKRK